MAEKKERNVKTVKLDGDANERIALYKWQGKTFDVVRTNRTTTIKLKSADKLWRGKPMNECVYIYSKSHIPESFFPIMKELKEMVKSNIEKNKSLPYSTSPFDIDYCSFGKTLKNIYPEAGRVVELTEITELDVTKAYYRTLFVFGYITQEFYEKCIALRKSFRLRLVGSIATSRTVEHYENGLLIGEPEVEEDEELRDVWFKVCSYVDESMKTLRALLGDKFLFYWVDGVYFKNFDYIQLDNGDEFDHTEHGFSSAVEYLAHRLKELYNFECEITPIVRLEISNKTDNEGARIEIRLEKVKNGKLEKKLFFPPAEQILYYELTDQHEFD